MLFVIVTRFKAHKVKIQKIKRKIFFIKQKREYIIYIDRISLQKKKKKKKKKKTTTTKTTKTTTTTTTKETIKKSQVLSLGLWRRRILFLTRLGDRSVLGLRISFFSLGLWFLCLNYSFLGLGSIFGL